MGYFLELEQNQLKFTYLCFELFMFVSVSVMHFFGCMIGKLSEQWLTEQWLAKAMPTFPKRDHHKTFVLSYLKRSFPLKTSGVDVPFWAQRIKSVMTEPYNYDHFQM